MKNKTALLISLLVMVVLVSSIVFAQIADSAIGDAFSDAAGLLKKFLNPDWVTDPENMMTFIRVMFGIFIFTAISMGLSKIGGIGPRYGVIFAIIITLLSVFLIPDDFFRLIAFTYIFSVGIGLMLVIVVLWLWFVFSMLPGDTRWWILIKIFALLILLMIVTWYSGALESFVSTAQLSGGGIQI